MAYKRILCLGLTVALACSGGAGEIALAQEGSVQEEAALGQGEIQSQENVIEDALFQYRELEDGTLRVEAVKDTAGTALAIPRNVGDQLVSIVGAGALQGCTALQELSVPSGVVLQEDLFVECSSLERIVLEEDDPNYVFEEGMLYDKGKEALIFCIRGKNGDVVLPETVKKVMNSAFAGCQGITGIRLPEGLTEIGREAFWGCIGLTQISLPKGVKMAEGNLFADCANLESIDLDAGNPDYTCQDGVVYNKDMTKLISFPGGKGGSFEIPESVLRIDDMAFYGCKKLESIRIPARTYMGPSAPNYFGDCDSLTELTIDASNQYAISRDNMLFEWDGYNLKVCPAGLKDAVLPEHTVKVCRFALASSLRETVTFPASVKEIEGNLKEEWSHPFVMVVPKGSYAESYAKEYGIEYRYVDEPTDPEETGNIQGFDYKRQKDGSIEITGYTGSEKEVTVPANLGGNQVSKIGSWAFRKHDDITKVVLEEGIIEIGAYAFAENSGLAEAILPKGLESIGRGAFSECTGLSEILLPEGLEVMYDDSFRGCSSLREVVLPRGIYFRGDLNRNPFSECYSLENISIAEDDLDFQCVDGVLYDKGKTKLLCCPAKKAGTLQIPGTVTSIISNGLQGCSGLTDVTLPEGLTQIGDMAFDGCSGLGEIQLPDSLEGIGLQAFRKCTSLKEVELPGKVQGAEQKAFSLCSNLEKVTVDAGNPYYTAQDGILYSKDMSRLLYIPAQTKGGYTVPQSVVDIAINALDDAVLLESFQIHKGVLFDQTHSTLLSFLFCKSLMDIEIEEGHANYYSKDGMVYSKEDGALRICPAGRTDPEVPEGVEKVFGIAFSVWDSESEEWIPKETITFPASVSKIQDLSKEMVRLMVVERESYAEAYAKEHEIPYRYTDGTYPEQPGPGPDQPDPGPEQPDPGPEQPIEGQDFLYQELEDGTLEITGYKGDQQEVSIPSKLQVSSEEKAVSGIGAKAFADHYNLEKVEIPQGVAYIGEEAFENCISLTSVSRQGEALALAAEGEDFAGTGNKAIGKGAFQNCIRLTSAALPDGITEIGEMAFQGCNRLQEIVLPDSLTRVGKEAFGGCESLVRIALPGQVAEIGEMAFQGCGLLAELPLPEGLKSIGKFAFVDCARLAELALPESLESIGFGAFRGCPSNMVLGVVPGSYGRAYAEENGIAYRYTRACDHSYEAQVTKEPACTQEGERLYTCKICEDTYSEAISALGHSYQTTVNQAAAKKEGSIVQQCARCDSRLETKIAAVKAMALAKVQYTYNGKAQSPKVTVTDSGNQKLQEGRDYTVSYPSGRKNPGSYTVTVQFCGNYSGTLQKAFQILPKGTSISKVTAKKNAFAMKWKKQAAQITGYEIQYSTSSKFTKKTTVSLLAKQKAVSKSVPKLKAKKKYYIRIRTYKNVKVNGKATKLSSGWSKVKSVTTKK